MADSELADLFHEAALFLIDRMARDGWRKFSANYLREHVRCKTGAIFTNSRSPDILRLLLERHPELSQWVHLGALKERGGGLFDG